MDQIQFATPEQQAETRRNDEERRAKAKAAKQQQQALAEAGRLARKQEREERERTNGNSVVMPVSETRAPRIVYVPSSEESEALRVTRMNREKNLLEARRRAERLTKAKQTKGTILELLKKQPGTAINILVKMAVEGGFEYARDDGKAAVYACMGVGVEIRIFGAALNPDAKKGRLQNSRLTEQQRLAAERREKSRAYNLQQAATPAQEQTQESEHAEISTEERAKIKAENIKAAAALKAAKALKQAQYKATHPKKVKQPKQAPKKDGDGKTQKQVRK